MNEPRELRRSRAFMKFGAPTTTTIDHVILSHPHRDHVELLPGLFATYQVRQVWDSGGANDICGHRVFLEAVRNEPGVAYHIEKMTTLHVVLGAPWQRSCRRDGYRVCRRCSLLPRMNPLPTRKQLVASNDA